MKTPDELREELDNVRPFRPRADASGKGAPPDWPFITYGEAMAVRAPRWLVKGLMAEGAFSVWFGPPKSGKSFTMLDLALHVAAGRQWRDRRVRQGRVLYLPVEAGAAFVNRLAAARMKFGNEPLPFHVLPVPLNLLNGDTDRLLAFIEDRVAQLGGKFDLIVVDTVSRSMPGANENSPEAMTGFVGAVDRIRASTGAHVACVHHVGKDGDRGMRGHSSLLGAVDLAVEISDRTIRVTACREAPDDGAWSFDLEVVTLGVDEDGDAITSCIVEEVEGTPEPKKARSERKDRPLGGVEKVVLECVDEALCQSGKRATDAGAIAPDIPARAIVVRWSEFDRITDRCMDKPGFRKREAVNRAMTTLQSRKLVSHVKLGEEVWLWRPASHIA